MKHQFASVALGSFLFVSPAPTQAAFFHTGDGSIDGSVCIGPTCISSETFGNDVLRLKANLPYLHFEDTSTGAFPDRDWRIVINSDQQGGGDYFAIQEGFIGAIPFKINATLQSNILTLSSDGFVGVRTETPQQELHVSGSIRPAIRLTQDGTGGGLWPAHSWEMAADNNRFYIGEDTNTLVAPFKIDSGTPSDTFSIKSTGTVRISSSMSTATPTVSVQGDNGLASLAIIENSSTRANRDMLILENNGRPRLVFINDRTDNPARAGEWIMSAGDTFVVQNRSGGMTENVYIIDADGNLRIEGEIITKGSVCGSGCDAVFAEDYDVKPIAVHAAEMFELGYLPNVGPTPENEPINLSDKLGRMLNELEHAHIYIAQLEGTQSELRDLVIAQQARLDALEQRLHQD